MTYRIPIYWSAAVLAYLCALIAGEFDLPLVLRLVFQVGTLCFVWSACTLSLGRMQPMAFYLPISGLYVLAPMLEVALLGNRLDLDAQRMALLADIGIGFLVCAAVGAALLPAASMPASYRPTLDAITANSAVNACVAMLVVSATMTLQRYGTAIGTISRADLYVEEYVLLSLVRGILSLSLGIAAAMIVAAERRAGLRLRGARGRLLVTLVVYTLVDLLILGDRRLPLIALLSVAMVLAPRRISWRAIAGAVGFVLLLTIYGMVRNTPPSEWASTLLGGEFFGALSPAANEFGGLAIIGGALDDLWRVAPDFPTYEQALLQVLPNALIDNRPLSPTEWFVWSHFPALAEIGASFAFNAVIEAMANGGAVGVAVAGGTTGLVISLLSRQRWAGAPIGLALASYIFTFSMRMDLASVLRTALVAASGLVVLLALTMLGRQLIAASQQAPRPSFAPGSPN